MNYYRLCQKEKKNGTHVWKLIIQNQPWCLKTLTGMHPADGKSGQSTWQFFAVFSLTIEEDRDLLQNVRTHPKNKPKQWDWCYMFSSSNHQHGGVTAEFWFMGKLVFNIYLGAKQLNHLSVQMNSVDSNLKLSFRYVMVLLQCRALFIFCPPCIFFSVAIILKNILISF